MHAGLGAAVGGGAREKLARDPMKEVERLLKILPSAALAGQAWKDYGEVIGCDDEAEMIA